MAGTEHGAEAVRAYRRVLGEVAANQAVAAAEDIVTDVWIAELEDARRDVLGDAGSIRMADRAARDDVRRAQQSGDPSEMARAQAWLTQLSLTRECDLDLLRMLLNSVDAAIEQACLAGTRRARSGRDDLARLRAAWSDAYG